MKSTKKRKFFLNHDFTLILCKYVMSHLFQPRNEFFRIDYFAIQRSIQKVGVNRRFVHGYNTFTIFDDNCKSNWILTQFLKLNTFVISNLLQPSMHSNGHCPFSQYYSQLREDQQLQEFLLASYLPRRPFLNARLLQ